MLAEIPENAVTLSKLKSNCDVWTTSPKCYIDLKHSEYSIPCQFEVSEKLFVENMDTIQTRYIQNQLSNVLLHWATTHVSRE